MIALFRLLARVPLPLMHRLGVLLGWLVFVALAHLPAALPGQRRRRRLHAWRRYRPAVAAAGAAAGRAALAVVRPPARACCRACALGGRRADRGRAGAQAGASSSSRRTWAAARCSARLSASASSMRTGRSRCCTGRPARPGCASWSPARASRARPADAAHHAGRRARQMLRALRAGGYTGLLPDQVPPQGQGVWAPFFGRAGLHHDAAAAAGAADRRRASSWPCASGCRAGQATRSASSRWTARR